MNPSKNVTTKLLVRGGRYYLRYRVPKRIQALGFPREVVKALKTSDHIRAQQLVLPKLKIMECIHVATDKNLLRSLFEELSDYSFTDQLTSFERENAVNYIDYLEDYVRDCMKEGCRALDDDFYRQIKGLTSHKGPLKTPIKEGDGEIYNLLLTLIEAHAANAYNGRSEDFDALLDRAKKYANVVLVASENDESAKTLFEVFDEFLAESVRKKIKEKMLKEYERNIPVLKAIAKDMPLSKVKRIDVRGWLIAWCDLPKRNGKNYKDLSCEELVEMDFPDEDLVSPKTVDGIRKMVQGIFSLAVTHGHIENSPATKLKLGFKNGDVTYAKFTDGEVHGLQQVANSHAIKKKQPWRRWMPLLASYTGARRGELVKLTKADIEKDKDTGRYFISIEVAKTDAGIRRIPVHNNLVKEGFIEFIDSLAGERLFDRLKPSQVTGWFTRLKEEVGVPDEDASGNRKVFHSYRHTVVTKIRSKGISDQLTQPVIGHSVQQTVTDTYSHLDEEPIKTFLPVIDAIAYERPSPK